ncbi:MAG: HAMP domain-containing histidine kinase [Bacteroidales bacterium]|nr:HAMP domain-containing histidine kinase [Bacteroidales bacterium]MCB8999937.1 HAMP domain-containing histidine kinase [Bacteroidales bacterium]MCB9012612.1 HAMP domain-containing histidine kinase [Bacteroidales bacterium]
MKFLSKINRNYLILFAASLLLVSVSGYFLLQLIFQKEAKEKLLEKVDLVSNVIINTQELPNFYPLIETRIIPGDSIAEPCFRKVNIYDKAEDEMEVYLELVKQVKIGDNNYSVKVRQSAVENEDLILILALFIFVLLLAAFGISFYISRKVNSSVWADFEYNLQQIENYNFEKHDPLSLTKSQIEEFNRLNEAVNKLTEKLKNDYNSLKEFSENASHELQTPLAIVMMQLDEILQSELPKDSFTKVVTAINSIKKLSRLSKSLTWLIKIENRQFKQEAELNINDIVNLKKEEYSGLLSSKKIQLVVHEEEIFRVKMNKELAEILIANLLSNAINHNIEEGTIQISIRENEFRICNTGINNPLDNDTIFERFSKAGSTSFGLGLAIVKRICDTHELLINYSQNDIHCFSIIPKNH